MLEAEVHTRVVWAVLQGPTMSSASLLQTLLPSILASRMMNPIGDGSDWDLDVALVGRQWAFVT